MKNHKILIMMLYYERPLLVVEALKSILRANVNYNNWHLAFHDDASTTPGEPIVRNILPAELLDKVTFYKTVATKKQKDASGGMLGHIMNQMIKDSDSELALILCDDDILHNNYLYNLNCFFNDNQKEHACYSHVVVFDPNKETWENATNTKNPLNYYTTPINPENKLDACQVAWKTSLNKIENIWFPYPCRKNHDAVFYRTMYEKIGPISFSGFVSQYKAIHEDQLSQTNQEKDTNALIDQGIATAAQHYMNGDVQEARRLCEQILKIQSNNEKAISILKCC